TRPAQPPTRPNHSVLWLSTQRPRDLAAYSHFIGFAALTAAHSSAAPTDADLTITRGDDLMRQLQHPLAASSKKS
ncbi:MAG: hypothetical protein AAFU71_06795, partial [Cyanobacteria bacterium J06632_22]